uniref:Capsid protein n=1 Tax=viral metagenome TaxID=1070528 RepID=A0A6M3IFE5_9ZZZZ
MGAHNWSYDADVGIYKNHAISNDLKMVAVGACKLLPFTSPVSGFGKKKGETINIMHIKELPDAADSTLSEDTRIPVDKLEWGNRALTVTEWGRGAEYTHLNEQLSKFDPGSQIQKALTRQMNRALDTGVGAAMQSTDVKICFIPTSLTGGTFDTDGTPSTVATSNLTAEHMGLLADYLDGNIHCPPYNKGDEYIMVSCRKTLRGLKDDRRVQEVHNYLQKGALFFNGEIGMIENIRMVQISREDAISNTAGTSTVLGNAVLFGDEAIARVEVEAPELRAQPNTNSDFGRVNAVAWYGILCFGSYWSSASDGESKIIRITSA